MNIAKANALRRQANTDFPEKNRGTRNGAGQRKTNIIILEANERSQNIGRSPRFPVNVKHDNWCSFWGVAWDVKKSHDGAEELLKAPTNKTNLRLTEQFF